MDAIALTLGPITITWYAIFIISAIIIGILLSLKEIEKHGIDKSLFYDIVFYLIIFGFLGARTWYVLFNLDYYLQNPAEIIAIWNGGLAIHGAIVAGGLYLWHVSKKLGLDFFNLTDIAVVPIILGQAIGRWGNFMNQEAHGPETTKEFLENTLHLPDFIVNGMNIDGVYYHPTFLYESIWNFIGFIIILIMRKKYRFKYGTITGFYLIWYGFIRTIIEQLRTDALMLGPIRIAALTSFLMVIIGVIILFKKWREYE